MPRLIFETLIDIILVPQFLASIPLCLSRNKSAVISYDSLEYTIYEYRRKLSSFVIVSRNLIDVTIFNTEDGGKVTSESFEKFVPCFTVAC